MLAYNETDNFSYLDKNEEKLTEHFNFFKSVKKVGGATADVAGSKSLRKRAGDLAGNKSLRNNLGNIASSRNLRDRLGDVAGNRNLRDRLGDVAGSRNLRDSLGDVAGNRGLRDTLGDAAKKFDDIPLDRLKKMDVSDLKKLDPKNLGKLDAKTLGKLDPKTLGKLDPKAMKKLDVSTLNKLDPGDLKKLDGKTLKKLDADTLKKMDIDGLKKLDGKTLKRLNLSPDYVKDIQKARRKTFGFIKDNKGKIIGVGILGGLAAASELGAFAPGGIFEDVPFLGGEDGLLADGLFGEDALFKDPLECVKDPIGCVKQPFVKMFEWAKKNFKNALFVIAICLVLWSMLKKIIGI